MNSDRGTVTMGDDGAEVTFVRSVEASVSRVWRLLTETELLEGWLAPSAIDLVPGGRVSIDFGEDGGRVEGRITELEHQRLLAYTWVIEGEGESDVRWMLEAQGDRTLLTLTHRRLPASMGQGYAAGWHAHLDRLEALSKQEAIPDWQERFEAVLSDYASSDRSSTGPASA